jgi:hypothetical protein
LTVLPGKPAVVAGGWFWLADPREIDAFLVSHYDKEPSRTPNGPMAPSVTLIRPEGVVPDAWHETRAALEAAGYRVRVDETRPLQAVTQVISQKGDAEGAQRLVDTLGVGRVLVASVGDLRTDYTVRLGADWLSARHP